MTTEPSQLTVCVVDNVVSPIVGLLFIRGPSAIFRTVRAVVVFAIKRKPFWPIPHVFPKVCKRKPPTSADFDASPSVSWVVFASRIATSIYHSIPRFICLGVRTSVLGCGPVYLKHFDLDAPATCRVSGFERVDLNESKPSAGASAVCPSSSVMWMLTQDRQPSVSIANYANSF